VVGTGTVRPTLARLYVFPFFSSAVYFIFVSFVVSFLFVFFLPLVLFFSFVGCCGVKHTAATVVEMCFLVVQRLYPKLIDYF